MGFLCIISGKVQKTQIKTKEIQKKNINFGGQKLRGMSNLENNAKAVYKYEQGLGQLHMNKQYSHHNYI